MKNESDQIILHMPKFKEALISMIKEKIKKSNELQAEELINLKKILIEIKKSINTFSSNMIYEAKNLSENKNNNIIIIYEDKNKEEINSYKTNKKCIYLNDNDIEKKRKNMVLTKVKEQLNKKEALIACSERDIEKHYEDYAYHQMLTIEEETEKVYEECQKYNTKYDKKTENEEKYHETLEKFMEHKENSILFFKNSKDQKNCIFFNKNVSLSNHQIDAILKKYAIDENALEELKYYLNIDYNKNIDPLKKNLAQFIAQNSCYFKEDDSLGKYKKN